MNSWSNGGCNKCVFRNTIGQQWSKWKFCPYCGRKLVKSKQDDSKTDSNANPMIEVGP